MRPDVEELRNRAEEHGQGHIFRWWDELETPQQDALLAQVADVDFDLLDRLIDEHIPQSKEVKHLGKLEPAEPSRVLVAEDRDAEKRRAAAAGREALREGQVAALVVAGGQGTRLGYEGPKGTFPASPIRRKPLFQIHAEKLLAARRRWRAPIPWYVMTSAANDAATREFFAAHGFFGLPAGDVCFFQQGMLPVVSRRGKILMARKHQLATSPDGHGGTVEALRRSGALADLRRRRARVISYFQVDNPLVRVVDPAFLGYHLEHGADFTSKALPKRDPEEGLGVFCYEDGKLRVVEYSDLPKRAKHARRADGSLAFEAGSIAIHALNVGFLARLGREGLLLPYHRADKHVDCVDAKGRRVQFTKVMKEQRRTNGVKFERFIFDVLAFTDRAPVLMTERAEEFAPVKNARGEDSPATARRAQVEQFARWLEAAGVEVPRTRTGRSACTIEVSPLFADSAAALRRKLPAEGVEVGGELLLE